MRIAWFVVVVLIVAYTLFNVNMNVAGVKSAAQASQLYDEASMWLLAVIAVTLAWQLAFGRQQQSAARGDPPARANEPVWWKLEDKKAGMP